MINFESTKKKTARIEIIPMIDVMMFLLVFFVLISTNVIPSTGLSTLLPQSAQASKSTIKKSTIVTITKTGQLQLNGETITLEQLGQKIGAIADVKEMGVTIKSDAESLMQNVIDVMDVLKQAGVAKVSIATKSKPS